MADVSIITLKENFNADGNRVILCREEGVPEMVPGYPEGPAYTFFFVDLKYGQMLRLDNSDLRALYKHVRYRRDRIFVWHYLKGDPDPFEGIDEAMGLNVK